jgi:hypothetical protein
MDIGKEQPARIIEVPKPARERETAPAQPQRAPKREPAKAPPKRTPHKVPAR